jgi:hypothetical protein
MVNLVVPSSQTMLASLIGSFLVDLGVLSYFTSGILYVGFQGMTILAVIVSGQASLAQACVGTFLGIVLHIYSTRFPQIIILIDFFLHVC